MRELRINAAGKSFEQGRGKIVHALERLSLEVQPGELLTLVGPSGCGKTTLLRAIAGLEQLSSGEILLGAERIDQLPPARRPISMSFQQPALYPQMSVRGNIQFPLKLRKVPGGEARERVDEIAILTGVKELLERAPHTLSGGEQQRVALARALVVRPEVLLLDEPLVNLDLQTRIGLRTQLWKLQRASKVTCIFVTHDQAEAMALGDRVAVMEKGKIIQCASPSEVYQEPSTRFVAEFIGSPPMNFFRAELEGGCLRLQDTPGVSLAIESKSFARTAVIAAIRPEDIQPSESGVPALVEKVDELGSEAHLHCTLGSARFVVRTGPGILAGAAIQVEFRRDRWHLFDVATGDRLS